MRADSGAHGHHLEMSTDTEIVRREWKRAWTGNYHEWGGSAAGTDPSHKNGQRQGDGCRRMKTHALNVDAGAEPRG